MPDTVTFGLTRTDAIIIAIACASAGVALGFFLPALGTFAAQFPIPFGDAIEKLSQFDQPLIVTLRPVIGAVLGLGLAGLFILASPRLTISFEDVVIERRGEESLRISKESISSVYLDSSGKLTILTSSGHPVFQGKVEGEKKQLSRAFTDYGYRWGRV
ncbi:hypothetical protein [Auritidibacter sp. NML130574]|uniref:YqeB family protein n=1 Tax=Auritidibacter sp. NML130574 TaxID=2170745 RepID=UPI001FEE8F1F|nr:hypothetical protein [Auritidibacter sp. NML130574]